MWLSPPRNRYSNSNATHVVWVCQENNVDTSVTPSPVPGYWFRIGKHQVQLAIQTSK